MVRREEILAAASDEFAEHGLDGTSTDVIARKAGVSQPYLFRLFGTKKELYLESVRRCLRETLELFEKASAGKTGEDALEAMGNAYVGLLEDRRRLRAQMQAYADCDDEEVREIVRAGYGELVELVEQVSGLEPERIRNFFACAVSPVAWSCSIRPIAAATTACSFPAVVFAPASERRPSRHSR